jgi:hypothetical protein
MKYTIEIDLDEAHQPWLEGHRPDSIDERLRIELKQGLRFGINAVRSGGGELSYFEVKSITVTEKEHPLETVRREEEAFVIRLEADWPSQTEGQ